VLWLLSRAVKGQNVAPAARALLDNPPMYGEACAALVAQLAQSGQFTKDDLLAQLRLAGEMHATGPSRRTALLLGASDTRAAQAVDFPALAMARGIGSTRAEHEIYLVAIGRMARTSLKLATVALNKNAPRLSAEERAIGWSNIALAASLVLAPEAYDDWQRAAGAPLVRVQAEWKTRIALRRGDWKMVRATIDAMPADAARRAGLDLLAGPRRPGPGPERGCAGAVPPHRRPEQFLWPAGDGRAGHADHDCARRFADRPPRPSWRRWPPIPASNAR
jgi:soluble lytic murein transglycosylase